MTTNPQGPQHWDPSQPPAPAYSPAPVKEKSWFARHKFVTALLAIVAIAVISSAMNGGKTPAPSGGAAVSQTLAASDDTPAASEETPADEAPTAAKVGSKVRDGAFEFTVTKVEKGLAKVGGQYINEKAQGQFVLVHVTVENIGSEPQTLIDSEQKVTDAQGRAFTTDTSAAISIEDNDVFFNQINPGNTVKGILVYDMPKGATPASIELHDSMFSGGVTVFLS